MNRIKRLIPRPPTPPVPPGAPTPPAPPSADAHPAIPQKPGFSPEMIGALFQKSQGGKGPDIPKIIAEIRNAVSGGTGPYADMIRNWIKNFPLDRYRDENGKICCPVPKEKRDRIMKRLKGEA